MSFLIDGSECDCRGDGDGGAATATEAQGPPPGWLGWPIALSRCIRQARRWHVPPRWAPVDWGEELQAEAASSAWQAICNFDPERGLPLDAYIRSRVMFHLLGRYRKEWAYARRMGLAGQSPLPEPESRQDFDASELRETLSRLGDRDRKLLTLLFSNGRSEAEAAEDLGISQQAVNKRKLAILHRLRRLLDPEPEAIPKTIVVKVRLRINTPIVGEGGAGRGDARSVERMRPQ
jgi:RNA polymerase sigma factor (sigma-70 family)